MSDSLLQTKQRAAASIPRDEVVGGNPQLMLPGSGEKSKTSAVVPAAHSPIFSSAADGVGVFAQDPELNLNHQSQPPISALTKNRPSSLAIDAASVALIDELSTPPVLRTTETSVTQARKIGNQLVHFRGGLKSPRPLDWNAGGEESHIIEFGYHFSDSPANDPLPASVPAITITETPVTTGIVYHDFFLRSGGRCASAPRLTLWASRTQNVALKLDNMIPSLKQNRTETSSTTTRATAQPAALSGADATPPPSGEITATTLPSQPNTVRQELARLLAQLSKLPRPHFAACCNAQAKVFLRLAGVRADAPPEHWTAGWCRPIREATCAESPAIAKQTMRGFRYLLELIPGFPLAALAVFRAPSSAATRPQTSSFTAQERQAMYGHLRSATGTQKVLFLLGANLTLHLGDAASTRLDELPEFGESVYRGERSKSGNHVEPVLWPETSRAIQARRTDPEAVYLFPELIFSAAERLRNPTINHTRLTAQEEQRRAPIMLARARSCFARFLEACGIHRPGLSYRSFRLTNISLWEAMGIPRRVGMAVSGHTEERDYLRYAKPTRSQLASLAELTLQAYQAQTETQECRITRQNPES